MALSLRAIFAKQSPRRELGDCFVASFASAAKTAAPLRTLLAMTVPQGVLHLKPRLIRLLLALVALGALVGLSYTVATWVQADTLPSAPIPPRTIPDTDVNPYGANFFLDREVEDWKRDRTVRMAREAGIVWAKQQFSWEEIEKRKGQFDWSKSDQIVATFEKYGMQIIARLDRPPAWSHQGQDDSASAAGRSQRLRRFRRRIRAAIHRACQLHSNLERAEHFPRMGQSPGRSGWIRGAVGNRVPACQSRQPQCPRPLRAARHHPRRRMGAQFRVLAAHERFGFSRRDVQELAQRIISTSCPPMHLACARRRMIRPIHSS